MSALSLSKSCIAAVIGSKGLYIAEGLRLVEDPRTNRFGAIPHPAINHDEQGAAAYTDHRGPKGNRIPALIEFTDLDTDTEIKAYWLSWRVCRH